MRNDIKNHLNIAQTIVPANYQATATGTDVDLANFDAAAVVITVGTATDTGFSFEVQEADDDGTGAPDTYAAVVDADLDGTEPATAVASSTTVLGYHGIKRWLRVVATDTGTGNADFGVAVVRAAGRVKP
ncbi:hypothetical protein [Streptomyces sp. WMMC897]|uniref:hypothetical protein n=1 Tax=Streptomyces sp. WMMC897 TaxID=3014782 RepID=UPI0022B653D3|nr:hypothetical protein [Streptomyces sp. WMMC897]MCZ7414309.1 hypothetical protein [Streptomyces sp. WMMC897]